MAAFNRTTGQWSDNILDASDLNAFTAFIQQWVSLQISRASVAAGGSQAGDDIADDSGDLLTDDTGDTLVAD